MDGIAALLVSIFTHLHDESDMAIFITKLISYIRLVLCDVQLAPSLSAALVKYSQIERLLTENVKNEFVALLFPSKFQFENYLESYPEDDSVVSDDTVAGMCCVLLKHYQQQCISVTDFIDISIRYLPLPQLQKCLTCISCNNDSFETNIIIFLDICISINNEYKLDFLLNWYYDFVIQKYFTNYLCNAKREEIQKVVALYKQYTTANNTHAMKWQQNVSYRVLDCIACPNNISFSILRSDFQNWFTLDQFVSIATTLFSYEESSTVSFIHEFTSICVSNKYWALLFQTLLKYWPLFSVSFRLNGLIPVVSNVNCEDDLCAVSLFSPSGFLYHFIPFLFHLLQVNALVVDDINNVNDVDIGSKGLRPFANSPDVRVLIGIITAFDVNNVFIAELFQSLTNITTESITNLISIHLEYQKLNKKEVQFKFVYLVLSEVSRQCATVPSRIFAFMTFHLLSESHKQILSNNSHELVQFIEGKKGEVFTCEMLCHLWDRVLLNRELFSRCMKLIVFLVGKHGQMAVQALTPLLQQLHIHITTGDRLTQLITMFNSCPGNGNPYHDIISVVHILSCICPNSNYITAPFTILPLIITAIADVGASNNIVLQTNTNAILFHWVLGIEPTKKNRVLDTWLLAMSSSLKLFFNAPLYLNYIFAFLFNEVNCSFGCVILETELALHLRDE